MEHQITIPITPELIRRATLRYWLRFTGFGAWAAWTITAAVVAWMVVSGDRSWVVGALGVAVALLPAIWISGYCTLLQRAWERLKTMQRKEVDYTFSDRGVGVVSELGTAELPWSAFKEVWRFRDVWILFNGPGGYVYLPPEALSEELRSFLLTRVPKHR
jgi:hypothetical protein